MSLNIGDAGISANYSFLVLLLLYKQLGAGSRLVGITVAYSFICYLVTVLVIRDIGPYFYLRQFFSFLLFLGPLCIALVRMPFDFTMLARATAWVSFGYAFAVMVALLATGTPITNAGMVKQALDPWVPDWPQRYTIVVMLGFFLAVYLSGQSRGWMLAAAVSGFCIAVSFGRATGLAMLGATMLLAILYCHRRDWHSLMRLSLSLSLSLMLVLAFVGNGLNDLLMSEKKRMDGVVAFVEKLNVSQTTPESDSALTTLPTDSRAMIDRLYAEGGEASGNIRMEIWGALVHRIIDDQMWLGSGFAGPYLFDAAIGSAHSQYVDILFRMGPIGLALYLGLWGTLLWRCFRHSPELGCGIFAWFIYGFFHETTKYSYGAFLFFSLLSLAWFGWQHSSICYRAPIRA